MIWISFHENRLKTGIFLLSQALHIAVVLVTGIDITGVPYPNILGTLHKIFQSNYVWAMLYFNKKLENRGTK